MCTWKIINRHLYTFYNLFLKLMKVKIYFSDPPIKSINSTWKKFKILKSVNFTGDIAFPHFFPSRSITSEPCDLEQKFTSVTPFKIKSTWG